MSCFIERFTGPPRDSGKKERILKRRNEKEREGYVPEIQIVIAADAMVKNKNISATKRPLILIGWKEFKPLGQWMHEENKKIRNYVKTTVEHQTRRYEDGWKLQPRFRLSSCEGVSHQLQSCEDGTSKQTRIRTTKESEKVNIKICVCLSNSLLTTSYFSLSK